MFISTSKYKKIIKLLKLGKPLVILNMETTGLSVFKDKIIEFAYIKIWPDGRVKKGTIMLNPQTIIGTEATAVHGYREKDVADQPTFSKKAQEIWDILYDCYYAGFNIINFDLPILRREFIRVGMDFEYKTPQIIDARIIFQVMVRRTLATAYEYYCHKEIKGAHNALVDVEAAAEIISKQLEKYQETRDISFINQLHESYDGDQFLYSTSKFSWREGEAYFAFSKYRDKPLAQVVREDPGFLKWMLAANFSEKTKAIVRKALKGDMIKEEDTK